MMRTMDAMHANNASRGVSQGRDKVKLHLGKGRNEIMLKVTNGIGGWGAVVRLADANGKPLGHAPGLRKSCPKPKHLAC